MEKKIHIYYINKIKHLSLKIFEYEDSDFVDYRAVANCQKAIYHWLDKAGITESELREEIIGEVEWYIDNSVERLKKLGWQVLKGKENL